MNVRNAALAAAALATIGLATACVPQGTEPLAAPVSGTAALPTYAPGPVTTPVAKVKNPLTDDGDFRIGTAPGQLPPGVYDAKLIDGPGYYALCRDVACKIGTGMIENDFMTADGIIEIPATTVLIKGKRGLVLTPAAGI